MCFIKMSSGNGESAANEPQPLISQQSMLMNQGCSKCTKEEPAVSPGDKNLEARLPPAHFPQSHPQLAPTRLAAQLSLCSQGAPLSLTGRREEPPTEVSEKEISPLLSPARFQGTPSSPLCQESPTIPISLLAGP